MTTCETDYAAYEADMANGYLPPPPIDRGDESIQVGDAVRGRNRRPFADGSETAVILRIDGPDRNPTYAHYGRSIVYRTEGGKQSACWEYLLERV